MVQLLGPESAVVSTLLASVLLYKSVLLKLPLMLAQQSGQPVVQSLSILSTVA